MHFYDWRCDLVSSEVLSVHPSTSRWRCAACAGSRRLDGLACPHVASAEILSDAVVDRKRKELEESPVVPEEIPLEVLVRFQNPKKTSLSLPDQARLDAEISELPKKLAVLAGVQDLYDLGQVHAALDAAGVPSAMVADEFTSFSIYAPLADVDAAAYRASVVKALRRRRMDYAPDAPVGDLQSLLRERLEAELLVLANRKTLERLELEPRSRRVAGRAYIRVDPGKAASCVGVHGVKAIENAFLNLSASDIYTERDDLSAAQRDALLEQLNTVVGRALGARDAAAKKQLKPNDDGNGIIEKAFGAEQTARIFGPAIDEIIDLVCPTTYDVARNRKMHDWVVEWRAEKRLIHDNHAPYSPGVIDAVHVSSTLTFLWGTELWGEDYCKNYTEESGRGSWTQQMKLGLDLQDHQQQLMEKMQSQITRRGHRQTPLGGCCGRGATRYRAARIKPIAQAETRALAWRLGLLQRFFEPGGFERAADDWDAWLTPAWLEAEAARDAKLAQKKAQRADRAAAKAAIAAAQAAAANDDDPCVLDLDADDEEEPIQGGPTDDIVMVDAPR